MVRPVVFVVPSRYLAVIYVVLIGSGLLLPLMVGRREHLQELVQTHCNQPGEWLPSISAVTGDKTPERFIWRYALVFGAGFRILTSFAVFLHFKTVLPASSATLVNFSYASDWARMLAAGGWTVVASNESWMSHTLCFAAYIAFGFILQITQFTLASRGKHHITHGDRNVRLKQVLLIGQTMSAFLNATLYMHHSRTCSLYSHATFFEWGFAFCNVLFDLTHYYDLEHETVSISAGGALTASFATAMPSPPAAAPAAPQTSSSSPVVLTASFAEAPSEALLWFCDIFFGYFFWSAIVHLVQAVYFLPMVAMETTIECTTLLFVGSPMLFFFKPLTQRLMRRNFHINVPLLRGFRAPGYWWLYALTLLSLLSVDVTRDPYLKIVSTSVGTLFLSYGFFLRVFSTSSTLAGPAETSGESVNTNNSHFSDAVRLLYALPLGLVVSMSLRYMYVSLDPLFADAFFNAIFGVALGLFNLVTLYRKAVYGEGANEASGDIAGDHHHHHHHQTEDNISIVAAGADSSESEQQQTSSAAGASEPLLGLCFGLAAILSVALVTAYGVIPRMLGLDPAAGSGLLIILSFALGVFYAGSFAPVTNALPMAIQRRPTMSTVLTYAPARTFLLIAGFLIMTFSTLQSNRVKETHHAHFPTAWDSVRANVDVKDWYAEEMWGSPSLAFVGGLMLVFGLGASWPPVMAFAVSSLRAKRCSRASRGGGSSAPPSRFRSSFELFYFATFFVFIFGHVFVVDHPFIPGAWILRDSLHIVLGANVVMLAVTLNFISIKGSAGGFTGGASSSLPSLSLPRLSPIVFGSLMWLLLVCVLVRVGHQPGSNSIPIGKVTVAEHQEVVLKLANQLLEFQSQLNSFEDPNFPEIKRVTMTATTHYELAQFEKEAVAKHGEEIFTAAKNIAPISGMIWTVHFGLDNFNNDNILRLAEMAKATKAGIVGLLESDSQRIINGNRDMVELMAYQLGFDYSDWGPTTFDGTFGCALISKYPISSVKRYVLPSPLGELACLIHANVDIFGIPVHVYVGHWGNTQHWADGILQSQFLGKLVQENPGPSIFLGYLVSKPEQEKYNFYAKEGEKGMLIDTAKELYRNRPWEKVHHHAKNPSGAEFSDPPYTDSDDHSISDRDKNYQRPPSDAPVRYFFFPKVKRYSTAHPRWEYKDRYCQYIFYKSGLDSMEKEVQIIAPSDKAAPKINGRDVSSRRGLAHFQLLDWWRVLDIHELSDTEIQVVQLRLGAGVKATTPHDE
jgi:hypothetical protein